MADLLRNVALFILDKTSYTVPTKNEQLVKIKNSQEFKSISNQVENFPLSNEYYLKLYDTRKLSSLFHECLTEEGLKIVKNEVTTTPVRNPYSGYVDTGYCRRITVTRL
jgi:hypothetical protein